MPSLLRLLLLTIGLFLILTFSFLPIFYHDVTRAVSPAFEQLGYKHRYKPASSGDYPKYFHEGKDGGALHHYDGRFQHGILPDPFRKDAQTHMVRAYVEFSKEHELETWLAHGTLLGWWWNAKMLPWDFDIDVQLSIESFNHIATNYNQTVYEYSSDTIPKLNPSPSEPTETVNRSYLLDINPAYASRSHGDGENVIDGRFIDMRNGLYIDLTAVSENEPSRHPGILSDKNEHKYKTQDLYPLRATLFEGVMTKVPFGYVHILTEEYQEKALVITEHEGHRWNESSMLWTKKTDDELKLDREEAAKKEAEEKARKKSEKAAKAKAKAEAKTSKTSESHDDGELDQNLAPNTNVSNLEKEPTRRVRRAAVTEELVAEMEAEKELVNIAKRRREMMAIVTRRRERQDFL